MSEYRILQKIKDNPTQDVYQAQKLTSKGCLWWKKTSWIPLTNKWWSTAWGAEKEIQKDKTK